MVDCLGYSKGMWEVLLSIAVLIARLREISVIFEWSASGLKRNRMKWMERDLICHI